MIEFSFYTSIINLLLFLLMAVCTIIYIMYITFKYEHIKKFNRYCEISFVIYLLILTAIPLISAFDKRDGIINVDIYNNIFYIVGIEVVFNMLILIILKKQLSYLLQLFTLLITMPYITYLPFSSFTFCYIISSVLLIFINSHKLLNDKNNINNNISNIMISEGIDTLDSGVMFCNEEGYGYLTNQKMKNLMLELFLDVHNNGELLWNDLYNKKIKNYDREIIGNEVLLRSDNYTIKCEKNIINIKNKHYYEIICSDITNLDKSIQMLRKTQNKLIEQEKEILDLTNQKIELSIIKQHAKLRIALHDDFGQKLTLLQRIVGSNDSNILDKAFKLLDSMDDVFQIEDCITGKENLDDLVKSFKEIGININIHGKYPKSDILKELLFYATRECSINAVKHASSLNIDIIIKDDCITIKNDGMIPHKNIVEGSGLQGLRSRVEQNGLILEIQSFPVVKIIIKSGGII